MLLASSTKGFRTLVEQLISSYALQVCVQSAQVRSLEHDLVLQTSAVEQRPPVAVHSLSEFGIFCRIDSFLFTKAAWAWRMCCRQEYLHSQAHQGNKLQDGICVTLTSRHMHGR